MSRLVLPWDRPDTFVDLVDDVATADAVARAHGRAGTGWFYWAADRLVDQLNAALAQVRAQISDRAPEQE